ncbi:heme-copper oxidase subunit III [Ktedonosporobacter rubrisoli]|uniref:Heme-copper oxidase subunit III n=1 Tax=Ktedonosporobacter rubrisoli TaxID=2509675 RepID=A0A4P6JZG5_KTERU|nr:heme-copper oxidase subunit III [Ktedonosporobacter rubrisoli]QBD81207.1 heme-copper oxidase subunit III [Ktedonosporobacter rubrisoli]
MSAVHSEQVSMLEGHAHSGRSPEWWGMVFFIASEALIFANFIAAFLYLEIRGLQIPGGSWVLPSGEHLPVLFPAINTIFLLGSSIPARIAGAAAARGDRKRLIIGLLCTVILGAIFIGGQAFEYYSLYSEGFNLGYKTFGSAFFLLTGFHGLHVTVGLIFLIICLIRAIRGDFSKTKHFAVEAGEMYWHFVDGVWIFVFSTVYLLPFLLPH